MKQQIMNHQQIERKINRLAFQIIEHTYGIQTVYIGGVQGNGYVLAEKMIRFIQQQSDQQFVLFEIALHKHHPLQHSIAISIPEQTLNQQTVFLVDDVINSGKTMQYALMKIIQQPVHEVYTAVLIDRQHRKFPIQANFFGLSLSTTLQNHINVSLADNHYSAVLS